MVDEITYISFPECFQLLINWLDQSQGLGSHTEEADQNQTAA